MNHMVGKRMLLTSSTQRDQGDNNLRDRISELPNELLLSVLSCLSLREAAKTSVLSSRWRYLFASISCLDFDNPAIKTKVGYELGLLKETRRKFIKWVDHVLKFHETLTVKEFRVCFDLDGSAEAAIDKWLEFALRMRVEKIDLDLSDVHSITRAGHKHYIFPEFDSGFAPCFTSITSLSFRCVNVSQNVLEYLLANCSVLEQLRVHSSNTLVNLRVSGPSLKLKCLEILYCSHLRRIKIVDSNLVSFHYHGKNIGLSFRNLPFLKEATFSASSLLCLCRQVSSFFPQLENLQLDVRRIERRWQFSLFPKLNMLKELILKVDEHAEYGLFVFTPLFKLCPYIWKLVIEVKWSGYSLESKNADRAQRCRHKCLKVVEFVGYYGAAGDLEFAEYLFKNAVALEKVIIYPMDVTLRDVCDTRGLGDDHLKMIEGARNRAKEQLNGKVPSGVELLIL